MRNLKKTISIYNIIITVMYRTEAVFEFSYYSDNIIKVSTE